MSLVATAGFEDLKLGVLDASGTCISQVRVAAESCGVCYIDSVDSQDKILNFLASDAPDRVLLLHIEPPVEQGLDLCRAIRNRETSPCPFLPIIVISALATRNHVLMARDAGVDEFLASPFTSKSFRQRIEAIVFQRRGFVDVKGYFGPDRRRGAMAKTLGAERRSAPTLLIDPRTERVYLG